MKPYLLPYLQCLRSTSWPGRTLVVSQEKEPVDQEDGTVPNPQWGLRKCLSTNNLVFIKTKLWVGVHKIDTRMRCAQMLIH